ncbi:MAG: peptidase M16 [Rhodospirillaceae bacterium]|nr:peptidase M16 [Rhodospirillaceae bacterium]|tara:strand:+ start:62383 stop:63738 length:1356 start_codon:yes stop_codon:yes gene_type:complete
MTPSQGLAACFGILLVALILPGHTASGAVFSPKSFMLKNGMKVVVVTNRRAPVITQMVWYKTGAADEPSGKSGIAHFFEHLMFKGTKTVPSGEFSKIIARNGGRDNAFTSQDYTAYHQTVARDKLELVMRLEADRMRNLVLTDKEVLPERDVVLEERRSRTDNNPGSQLWEASRAALFLNHPYKNPVIGWKHEIDQLTTKDALAFYRRYYVPNNAILIVAGDVDIEQLKPLAEKYYGVIPRGPEIIRERIKEPPQLAGRRVELRSNQVGQPRVSQTFLAPSYATAKGKRAYALLVLAEIFGGSSTAQLYRDLVVEQGIASSAGAWYSPDSLDYGTFGVSVSPRPGVKLAKVEAAMRLATKKLLKNGVSAKELKRAVKSMVASAVYARDSLRAAPNIIGRALSTGRTIEDVETWPEKIKSVTVEDVNAAARAVLRTERSVTAILRKKRRTGG